MWADEQLDELMMTPNVPAKVIEAAKQFPAHVRALNKSKTLQLVGKRRVTDRERIGAVSAQVAVDHARLEELSESVATGAAGSLDAVDEINKIESRIRNAARTHSALESSEENYAAMEADPDTYWSNFYDNYPALRDRRINLRTYLAEQGLSS